MEQKIKSLIYFTCFVIASLIYYTVEVKDSAEEKENIVAKAELEKNSDKEALTLK